ncbi:SET domain-containing protein [Tubulinosema ratisbonensis]|uniref:[histone H3]-lysine(4) N-trimethyltransferase n=1 Tax=Tubulinosema ratisbonensis TaxID=291195 RepID=A0A437AM19_9MICR|nr:SET domain-containing protein [Tubulinosema ratisbonensis]
MGIYNKKPKDNPIDQNSLPKKKEYNSEINSSFTPKNSLTDPCLELKHQKYENSHDINFISKENELEKNNFIFEDKERDRKIIVIKNKNLKISINQEINKKCENNKEISQENVKQIIDSNQEIIKRKNKLKKEKNKKIDFFSINEENKKRKYKKRKEIEPLSIKERFDLQIKDNLEMIREYLGSQENELEVKIYAEVSKIHGIGIFAGQDVSAHEKILEYVGERIGKKVADKREKFYQRNNIRSIYLFKINEDTIIDATLKGNLARFINHSCVPNAYTVTKNDKIFIYALRDIKKNEEITFYYNFSSDDKDSKIPCYCGHENCLSFIV